jgi:hypothetical protein
MTDNWHATMNSYFYNGDQYSQTSPDGSFDYQLKTPLKASGSVAIIIGKYGLISADYDYIDYSTASLGSHDYSFSSENTAIRNDYTIANNFRFGAELKAGIAAFRGGYSYYGSPYKGSNSEGDRNGYSFGAGIRDKGYFMDFAFNHSKSMAYYYLYSTSPASLNTIKTNSYSLTFGFRF